MKPEKIGNGMVRIRQTQEEKKKNYSGRSIISTIGRSSTGDEIVEKYRETNKRK